MAGTVVEITGTTQAVDTFLGPVVRFAALLIGGLTSLVFWWITWTWWVPLPLAFALLSAEFWLVRRSDRAQTLRIEGSMLRLRDPLAEVPSALDLGGVTNATLFYRMPQELAGFRNRVVEVVLGDEHDVRFALRLTIGGDFEPRLYDVPVEPIDLLFGGIAGVFRALAPSALRPRQAFLDVEGKFIEALLAAVPEAAWRRTGLRLWTGLEPDLDLFGYYTTPHDGWLVLEGHDWRCGEESGSLRGWGLARSERSAVLFQGLEDRQTVERVSVGIIDLGVSTSVTIPMPLLKCPAETQPLTSDARHTHAPEGAALLWHLFLHTSRDRWPDALRDQIQTSEGGAVLASQLPGS